MKHYLIWLKSGEVVQGDIEDEKPILKYTPFILRFTDSEGTVTIKRHRIEAIAINDIVTTNRCGF